MAGETFASRKAILASQQEQLQRLLSVLIPANSFYSRKFEKAEVGSSVSSLSDYSARFPFTIKQELVEDQKNHLPYGTNLTYPMERYVRCHQTSGTTGIPLRWLDTAESWNWMVNSWKEVYRAAGVTIVDRVFFAFSFGPFIGFWLAFEAGTQMGCLCLPGGGLSSAARLRAILDHQATILCCTPTYAIRLAEVAAEEGIDLAASKVRMIIVAGEPGGSIPSTREKLQNLWPGARVFDHHGMTEVGPVTYECPARPGMLHVIESAYRAEIIDPASGKLIEPGQTGELVLTTLGRIGSPLLRYRTGDLVKAAPDETCSCGRSEMALDGGILGRVDDMIVVRGVNVFPTAVEETIRSFPGIAEYQVRITSVRALTEMQIRIEPSPEVADVSELVGKLEKAFLNHFALRVPVEVAEKGSLPRFELKAKRWIRD